MKKLITLMLALVLSIACCMGIVGCDNGGEIDPNKPIVGLITLHGSGSTYDKNFIDAFEAACKNKGLTEKQYRIVSEIDEKIECYDTAMDLVDKGCKAVFADSFGHEEYLIRAAKEAKDVQFFHATGTNALSENLSNFHNAFASIYEGRYLAGYAAGLKLNTMKAKAVNNVFSVGYVGAYAYAEVISGYTSWFLGLEDALDEGYSAELHVTFTNSWYTETGEQAAAQTLIDDYNCVLVSQHADSMGAPNACDTKSVPNVAYNGSTGKDTLVAYSKIDWTPYFEMMIDCAVKGTAVATDWTGTIATGSVKYDLGPAAADGTADKLNQVKAELTAGTRRVFDTSKFVVSTVDLDALVASDFSPITAYRVSGEGLNTRLTSLTVNGQEVIKTTKGITYFDESSVRSAPYFELTIYGVDRLDKATKIK